MVTMTGNAVALPTSTNVDDWSDEEKAVIEAAGLVFTWGYGSQQGQKVLAPRPVIARFRHTVERTGLDPLARQIYCIGRGSRDGVEWAIQTGIDGFRLIALRSGQYAGQDPAQWLTATGEWVDVFVRGLHGNHPLAARVAVYRHDWDRPAVGIATWDEYVQTKSNGDVTSMWAQRGAGQLAKCAEALALRKAFPQDLSGLYTDDEMATAVDADVESQPVRRAPRALSTPASRARAAAEASEAPVPPAGQETAGDGTTGPVAVPDEVEAEVVEDGLACLHCGKPAPAGVELCGECEDLALAAEAEGAER